MGVKLVSSSNGSVELVAPVTASNYTATFPANTGTVLTTASTFAGTGPAFSASAVGTFSIAANTWTKLQFNTEQFDTNNNYDSTTNYRFTPTVAGYYQFNFVNAQLVAGTGYLNLYKNGSTAGGGNQFGASGNPSGSMTLYMNGSTDYVEVYAYNSAVLSSGPSNATYVQFSGFLARAA
jgi:hypothetical protein